VAVVLPAAVIGVFLLASGQLRRLLSSRLLLGLLMCALVALPWYALVGSETKGEFLRGFFLKHNKDRFLTSLEGHSGPIFYHLGSLVVGFLPWSVLLAPALYYGWRRKVDCGTQNAECGTNAASPHSACYMPHSSRFLFCWIGVYLVFFSLSQTKLPSYILPIYPAVALLTGQFLQGWRHGVFEPPRWVMPVSLALFGLVGVGLTAGLLVAAGIIAMPGRVYQDLPGLEQFAGLGTLPVLGAAGATWSLILRERRAVLACIVTSGLLFVAMLALCTGRALDGHKAPRALVDAAGARQLDRDIRIGCYEWYQPSLVFYCQREVTTFYFEREALEFLQSPLPVYLFLPAQNWQQIEAKAEGPWHLVARHRCLYRNCEVVVVTNEK
jgi:4-amino-4-deoxy-L-arabinose transferase-like glycosyltransferase